MEIKFQMRWRSDLKWDRNKVQSKKEIESNMARK